MSASSVTFQASQPPTRRKTSVRKWLDLPPSGNGILSADNPVLITSKSSAYSMAKSFGSGSYGANARLRHKTVRQPAVTDIVYGELRLKAGKSRWRRGETRSREARLLRIGNIPGIIDRNQFASEQRQRDIERAWLCPRRSRRRERQFAERRYPKTLQGFERFAIVLFEDQFHVQLGRADRRARRGHREAAAGRAPRDRARSRLNIKAVPHR